MLNAAELPVPVTMVSQNVSAALEHFERLGGDVVVKPLFGSMGNGIVRLRSIDQAKSYFQSTVESADVIYQQEFIKHEGFDIRLLVIGDKVVGMKRKNDNGWITNINQGGVGEPHGVGPRRRR